MPHQFENGLAFGRLDFHNEDRFYIGRIGLFDEDKEYEPLLDKQFVEDRTGDVWTFFGLVHGSDDYYYGMSREGALMLLSCVGSIEAFGFTLAEGNHA